MVSASESLVSRLGLEFSFSTRDSPTRNPKSVIFKGASIVTASRSLYKTNMRLGNFGLQSLSVAGLVLCASIYSAKAQTCPTNIDFEQGNLNGWDCFTGMASENAGVNNIMLSPSGGAVPGRHTILPRGSGVDPYGGFPVNCPNGSGFSVRLGNSTAGTEAEGISYTFTIPANQDIYSLIYHYAVVFQDPDHQHFQQPRLELEITNLTDGELIECSSFTFVPYGSILPGFFESQNPGGETPVWCKDWSAVSINLNGHAGKTIRLFFKTADCTFRRHFGYAYIDVNSECSSEFVGATYCPDDTVANVTAPFGYQSYTWYNSDFSQIVGNQQTISFTPLPISGTTYAVQVVPYNGYGCLDTFYAKLIDTLTVKSYAGLDAFSCNKDPVEIGGISKPGLSYSWSPAAGLTDPKISNPYASPDITTAYVLTTSHDGGGCRSTDTVIVKASNLNSMVQVDGKFAYCSTSGDSAVLRVTPTQKIQWFKDNKIIAGATQPTYRATQSGNYHALLYNADEGCSVTTAPQKVTIDDPKPAIRYPIVYAVIDIPHELKARDIGDIAIWSPGTWLNTRNSFTPKFTGQTEQLYTIEIGTNSGCVTIDTQLVKTVKKPDIHVPNAFSPNNDGQNDYLRPILWGIKEVRYFRVFNRWGNLLYENTTSLPGWDGRLNGVPQTTQVVVWMVEGLGMDGSIYRRKGTTVLVR